jgi:CheY-like chemotaxis protein
MTQEKLDDTRRALFKTMLKRVLLVQDDKYLLDILASILRFSGYDVVEAKSGSEAIDKAASLNRTLFYWTSIYPI